MGLEKSMEALGVTRIVWIDDLFTQRPRDLAAIILEHPEAAEGIPELSEALEGLAFDPEGSSLRLRQRVADLPPTRREEILDLVLAAEAEEPPFKTPELIGDVVQKACELLKVADEDRLSFQDAPERLSQLLQAGDDGVGYIIDLNEAGGSDTRGLDMLQILWADDSRGVPFILTHAAKADTEGEKEAEFRYRVVEEAGNPLGIPIAVIAKERLPLDASDVDGICEAFEIGLKRAGLRKAVHTVLGKAHSAIIGAYQDAANSLLRVAPEQLDSYVVERGYVEGVSELHVIERALTAHTSQSLRGLFARDPDVAKSLRMLRALRPIRISPASTLPSAELAEFRKAEIWDSDELVNGAFSPVACGDVFELDSAEEATKALRKRFVLLGQPCDIALRGNGKRAQAMGILVPVKVVGGDAKEALKAPLLPFKLDGEQWGCDFRQAAMVKLSILDFASFRDDGRVRVDVGQSVPSSMLLGQEVIHGPRLGLIEKVLSGKQSVAAPLVNENLSLTLSEDEAFKHVKQGVFKDAFKRRENRRDVSAPDRVTWHLRRVGRIRMPFAAALLEQLLTVMSRRAFDLDY